MLKNTHFLSNCNHLKQNQEALNCPPSRIATVSLACFVLSITFFSHTLGVMCRRHTKYGNGTFKVRVIPILKGGRTDNAEKKRVMIDKMSNPCPHLLQAQQTLALHLVNISTPQSQKSFLASESVDSDNNTQTIAQSICIYSFS